jgi:hypothetical protein
MVEEPKTLLFHMLPKNQDHLFPFSLITMLLLPFKLPVKSLLFISELLKETLILFSTPTPDLMTISLSLKPPLMLVLLTVLPMDLLSYSNNSTKKETT